MTSYTLEQLLDERNRELYDGIAARITVRLESSDSPGWSEATSEDEALIFYSDSPYPISCFTHELLHVQANIDGAARPCFLPQAENATSLAKLQSDVEDLLPYAYNQVIHHHFFPRFCDLGFSPCEFLDSSDHAEKKLVVSKHVPQLKRRAKDYPHGVPMQKVIWPYLFLKSPEDNTAETVAAARQLRNMSGNKTYRVDEILKEVREDEKPNVPYYMARLFAICGLTNVGFGYQEDDLIWSGDVS